MKARFAGVDVYTCGPWCQGPVLLQMLGVLEGIDLKAMGHNSLDYAHTVTEAIKLAFADRERYYGDPRFVQVPIEALLSDAYSRRRREMLRPDRAWPEMPPCGEIPGFAYRERPVPTALRAEAGARDTSYVCVVDKDGNVLSATPSDPSFDTPVIPGTGLCPSSRGSQSWSDPSHASSVAPGKRPRLTPSPALAILPDGSPMPFGTPGGDVQAQAMLQVFLNMTVFAMNPQQAVEAARFASYSFPDSFEPHSYSPGLLHVESRVPQSVREGLAARGHTIEDWPEFVWRAGAVCVLRADRTQRRDLRRRRPPAAQLRGGLVRRGGRRHARHRNPRQPFGHESGRLVAQHHDQQRGDHQLAHCGALHRGHAGHQRNDEPRGFEQEDNCDSADDGAAIVAQSPGQQAPA